MATKDEILKALERVNDPELHKSIVELGMVRSIEISEAGAVVVTVSLTTPGCPIRSHFVEAVTREAGSVEGVTKVDVAFDVLSDAEKGKLQKTLGRGSLPAGALAQVSNVLCVGSGKGGVGKSTLTSNIAAALTLDGKRVGILDADVWGYSIPRMFGLGSERPPVSPGSQDPADGGPRREGHVDRLLRRGGRGGRLARTDAAQGAHAVPRGRRVG